MTKIYPFQRTARWLSLAFLAAALLLGGWATTAGQEPKKEKPARPESEVTQEADPREAQMLEMMKQNAKREQVEKGKPALSPHHEMLDKMAGHWKVQARMYAEPGGDPVETQGAVRNDVILNGRALQSEFKGTMEGKPIVGLGIHGYDTQKEQHFHIWMDSITTGPGSSHGSGDCMHGDRHEVTLHGEMLDPETGAAIKKKAVLAIRSASQYTYEEWHSSGDGEEMLAMQIIYSRSQ